MSDCLVPHGPMVKPYAFQPQPVKAVLEELRRSFCDRAVTYQVSFTVDERCHKIAVITVADGDGEIEVVDADLGPVDIGAAVA